MTLWTRIAHQGRARIGTVEGDVIRLHDGDLVLLTGFGAGMTWASAVVRWSA